MRLYEIDITSLWWVAAEDEMEAMNLLREELYVMECSEEEIDDVMDDLIIKEVTQDEAETVEVIDTDMKSLWSMFSPSAGSGLVYTDYRPDDLPAEDDEDMYREEGSLPSDWW